MNVIPLIPDKKLAKYPYDDHASFQKINSIVAQTGDLKQLVFHVGQAIIMAIRTHRPIEDGLYQILAQVLAYSVDESAVANVLKIARSYPDVRMNLQRSVCELLSQEPAENQISCVQGMADRVRASGFQVQGKPGQWTLHDLTGLPYPIGPSGKPRIQTVWMEITNHCNQKCNFCPDPERKGDRLSMDLTYFREKAWELHQFFEIGYWQLNAYGEPLLNPALYQMIDYLRKDLKSDAPIYFTSHGLTLTAPRLDKLMASLPSEVMISLHNDSQESYAKSRSEKIGNFELLQKRVLDLCERLVSEKAPCSVRLSTLVNNRHADHQVPAHVRESFSDSAHRYHASVVSFQKLLIERLKDCQGVQFPAWSLEKIADIFDRADHGPDHIIPIAKWWSGHEEGIIFFSPRPVGNYANQIPYQHDSDAITAYEAAPQGCGFTAHPSLAIFANHRMGICCIDLETTASFGHTEDHASLLETLKSAACHRMFANLTFGISDCQGCDICLGSSCLSGTDTKRSHLQ